MKLFEFTMAHDLKNNKLTYGTDVYFIYECNYLCGSRLMVDVVPFVNFESVRI